MIPKNIYYVWVGGNKKPDIFYKCLDSWQENLPGYTITEINETNFDIKYQLKNNKFFRECYKRKIWAFVSDYIRIIHLYENGGIYLDIDMEITKDISKLFDDKTTFFAGLERPSVISAGIIGAEKNSPILRKVLQFYKKDIWKKKIYTIPTILTYTVNNSLTTEHKINDSYFDDNIKIFPVDYFYPYPNGVSFSPKYLTPNTHGIHWWNESWGSLDHYLFLRTKHIRQPLKSLFKIILIIKNKRKFMT